MQIGDKVMLQTGSREYIIHLIINGEALLKKSVNDTFKIVDWYLCNTLIKI